MILKIGRFIYKTSSNVHLKRSYSSTSNKLLHKVLEKAFTVNPGFGNLRLNGNCNTIIEPANLQEYADANHASITFWSKEKLDIPPDVEGELIDEDTLKINLFTSLTDLECTICLPIKYDIMAKMEDRASVKIRNMESDIVEIYSKYGDIHTHNLKSKDVSFNKEDGLISTQGLLLGNVSVTGKNVTFNAKRLQGMEMFIQAGHLDANIESSYIKESKVLTESGSILFKHLHGNTNVHMNSGNVNISSLCGSLQTVIGKGTADVRVNDLLADSLVQVNEGNLHLSVQDPLNGDEVCEEMVALASLPERTARAEICKTVVNKISTRQIDMIGSWKNLCQRLGSFCHALSKSLPTPVIQQSLHILRQSIQIDSKSLDISPEFIKLAKPVSEGGRCTFKNQVDSTSVLNCSVQEGSARLSVVDWFSSLSIKKKPL